MKNISKTIKNWIYLCGVTVLAICLCCSFTACTKAQAESADTPTVSILDLAESAVGFENAVDSTEATMQNYSRWLSDHYSTNSYTREQWLRELMRMLKIGAADYTNTVSVFTAAIENGLIDAEDAENFSPLTRSYVAKTLVRALDYDVHHVEGVEDLDPYDTDMSTAVYYGYFVPDDYGRVNPEASVTSEEYPGLIEELSRYVRFRGKRVLAFGDSIMFGLGNNDRGIADMVAEKYGMSAMNFAISGATFGVSKDHSHIPDQIKTASATHMDPDIILINGGTNDMAFTSRGDISDSYQLKDFNENTFAGGFEYAAYLLNKYWNDVPVIYVRAHDMGRRNDIVEQDFGTLGMQIAEKWGFATVDIYNDTDFCTELDDQRDAYTLYRDSLGYSDGVHPTCLGYAKYYLPLVSAKVSEILG